MSDTPVVQTLKSGVRAVIDPVPGARTAAVTLTFGVGARVERAEEEGVAHLIEHAAFRGAGGREAFEIDAAIEDVGGSLNASTTHERTSFYARVRAEDAPLALDILADIVREPHLHEDDVVRERGVVLQEIAEAESDGEVLCLELLQRAAFGDAPLGRSVLGARARVRGHDAGRLARFIQRTWAAEELVVSVAGGVEESATAKAISERFSDWPYERVAPAMEPASFIGGRIDAELGDEQGHITLAFQAPAAAAEDRAAARILSEIWGGGVSSRLNRAIREERGLAYSVYSFYDPYVDTGLIGAYAAGDPADADEMAALMRAELESLAAGPERREFARAKAQLATGVLMGRESLARRSEAAAADLLTFGRALGETEVEARIAAVTEADVARMAMAALESGAAEARVAPGVGRTRR